MRTQDLIKELTARRDGFRDWLSSEAPYTVADQRHLDAHTPEQAYWHHGYEQALADVIRLLAAADSEATPGPDRQG